MDELDNLVVSSVSSNTDSEDMESELKNIAVKNKPGGGRFKRLGLKELDDLEQNRHANSTKRNTLWGLNIFQGNFNTLLEPYAGERELNASSCCILLRETSPQPFPPYILVLTH